MTDNRNGAGRTADAVHEDIPTVPRRSVTAAETYLRGLVARVDDPPLISDLTVADIGTPAATASIARAALCWLLDGRQEAIERRLRDELAEADVIFRWRMQAAELDMRTGYVATGRPSWAELQRRRANMLGLPVEQLGVAS